jgi:catechol 2,3-dioxygenase-like lactoylglutathione lyase family enzyme
MTLGGVSHLAFGVRDMDRSIAFYRDLLGMELVSDRTHTTSGGTGGLYADPDAATSRRVAQLRWSDERDAPFLVLSSFPAGDGSPLKLDQIGIHHIALWVQDLTAIAERLADAGVHFAMAPTAVDARGYGGVKGEQVLTCLFEDPDGTIIQLDERLEG